MLLHERLLEQERFGLCAGERHIDLGHAQYEFCSLTFKATVGAGVRANAFTQRLGLADVQDLPRLISIDVHARLVGEQASALANEIDTDGHRAIVDRG